MDNQEDCFWVEFKNQGKCVIKRSYHSACVYNNTFYIYGGYEVHSGQLNDFIQVELQEGGKWENVPVEDNSQNPGCLHRHTGVVIKDNYLIFGGQIKIDKSSNNLFIYNFTNKSWKKIEQTQNTPRPLDSHSACVWNNANGEEMIIFGGYYGDESAQYSNQIFKYNLEQNQWTEFQVQGEAPQSRQGSAISIIGNNAYIFGGTKNNEKMSDLWCFSLLNNTWQQIITENVSPSSRNGHTMVSFNNKIFLFGGIHDITHEKNDLFCFVPEQSQWIQLEQNTLVYNQNDNESQIKTSNKQNQQNNEQDKSQNINIRNKNKNKIDKDYKYQSIIRQQIDKEYSENNQQKNNEDKLKKKRQQKKLELLAEFQLNDQQKQQFEVNSPTTEALRNSIKSLGSNVNKAKENTTSFMKNNDQLKRPCARDGHSASLNGDKMIIFGGDRHLMSFNDLFMISLLDWEPKIQQLK